MKPKPTCTPLCAARLLITLSMLLLWLCPHLRVFAQGSLAPPGAPAPSMKTLDQIEARMPISVAPSILTDPGSYYLTTNLVGVANNYGIAILADNVTLDLNGFAVIGVNNAFTGIGIFGQKNVCVRNGTVRGWP